MRAPVSAGAFLVAVIACGPAPAAEGPAEELPFPVARSQILSKQKSVYTVEGRVRIPRGVEISCLKEITIKAKGSAPAVIEVEGSLTVHGVFQREVIFENVTVEPCPVFTQITMDMTVFRGNTGGVKTGKDQAVEGPLQLELFDFIGGASMDVCFSAGSIVISSVCADTPTKILVRKPPGKESSLVRLFVRGCPQDPHVKCTPHGSRVGLVGGLEADGGDDMTIQLSRIGGSLCSVRNWGKKLIFDGNKVNSTKLAFGHRTAGMFQNVQCAKLDIYSTEIAVDAPPSENLKDTFVMDRCWFKGATDPKDIFARLIKDGSDDPTKNGTRVNLPKIDARPHELAGEVER